MIGDDELTSLSVEVETELEELIEGLEDDVIDEADYAPAPEFSSFDVWCDTAEEWAAEWRPTPEDPWFCRLCGRTDHRRMDNGGEA